MSETYDTTGPRSQQRGPAAKTATAIMSDLRGRSGIFDGIDDDILEEIEEAIKGHVESQYGSDFGPRPDPPHSP